MLLNLVTPTAGTATIGGQRYADLADPLRARRARCSEASSAHKGRTGRNHLRVICAGGRLPQRASRRGAGAWSASPRPPSASSRATRSACGSGSASPYALLGDPRVLILDEPANGLDPEGIRWMRDLLQGLARQGRTVFVSSHLLCEMELPRRRRGDHRGRQADPPGPGRRGARLDDRPSHGPGPALRSRPTR